MATAAVTSAAPLLALLEEDDDVLKVHALKQLDSFVHQFWYQISNHITQVEVLCEDADFDHRENASLLASKVRLLPMTVHMTARCCSSSGHINVQSYGNMFYVLNVIQTTFMGPSYIMADWGTLSDGKHSLVYRTLSSHTLTGRNSFGN
jgi:hypothetical protein